MPKESDTTSRGPGRVPAPGLDPAIRWAAATAAGAVLLVLLPAGAVATLGDLPTLFGASGLQWAAVVVMAAAAGIQVRSLRKR
ncbi:MAG: hypothetical protein ACK5LS_14215 [Propioniciclava sp.]